jgi:trimethylamine---corrinoid protein Co-methyltransferase
MLADYEAPALDPGLDEQLQAFMARRKETLPDGVS